MKSKKTYVYSIADIVEIAKEHTINDLGLEIDQPAKQISLSEQKIYKIQIRLAEEVEGVIKNPSLLPFAPILLFETEYIAELLKAEALKETNDVKKDDFNVLFLDRNQSPNCYDCVEVSYYI